VKDEIDPGIQAELQEALSRAPTDELSKSYDPLSLLQKAENFYKDKNFVEAGGEYEYFLNLHPLHRWAPYAQYKLGLSYFHQIPTVDRDIEPVQKCLIAFQKLLDLYNNSPYHEDAVKKIHFCQEQLAEREFYIGHIYYKKSAYPAAIARFEGIVQGYPETQVAEKAMYYLALSYQGLGEFDKAKQGLSELLEKYPATPYRPEILRLLASPNGPET
jgi:outer membrane protein assembly factor BamD